MVESEISAGKDHHRRRGRAARADELLTQAQDRGSMDVVADFAAVLPLRVIVHALGVPVESEAQLQRWTQALGHVTSGYLAGSEIQHVREMLVSFRQVIGERGYRE